MLATEDTMGAQVLHRMGVDTRNARRAVVSALSGFVHAMTQPPSAPAIEPGLGDVLRRLDAIEQRLSDERHSA